MSRINVVIAVPRSDESFVRQLRSFDEQTLDVSDWQLVLDPADDQVAAELRDLGEFRPNLVVGPERDLVGDAGSDDWLLRLPPGQQIAPHALAHLAQAAGDDVDAVVGRSDGPLGFHPSAGPIDAGIRPAALASPCVLRRAGVEDPPAERISVVSGTPLLATTASTEDQSGGLAAPAHLTEQTLEWVGGVLRIRVQVRIEDSSDRVDLVAVEPGSGWSWPLASAAVETSPEGAVVAVSADLDLRELVAAGLPTPVVLDLGVQLVHQHRPGLFLGVAVDRELPAVIGDLLVGLRPGSKGAQLDVGCGRRSLVSRLDRAGSRVEEDARGSQLTVELPQLHHHDARSLPGAVHLGGLVVPATIEFDDNGARLQVWVSGLPGRCAVATRFGPGAAAPSGVDLVTGSTGQYNLEAPAPAPKKAPAKKAPGKKAAAKKAAPAAKKAGSSRRTPPGPLRRIRRHLPKALDPLVSAVGRQPSVRRILNGVDRRLR